MKDTVLIEAKEEDIPDIYNHLHRDYVKKYHGENEDKEWGNHRKWYKFIINSPYYILYVLKDKTGNFLGQLKFELDGETAVISLYLTKFSRGKGYGKEALLEGLKEIKETHKEVEVVLAYILEENEGSIKTFENSGFYFEKEGNYHGIEHMLYIKKLKP